MRPILALPLACLALLGACSTPAPEPAAPEPQPSASAAARPVASFAEVQGQWDVVSFEGYEPQRLHGTTRAAFADFGPGGVALRIECNYSGRPGTVEPGRFRAEPGGAAQTLMGCGPEREGRDTRYFAFFESSPSMEMLADGRLRLRSGESELILQRPAARRLANVPTAAELQGEWRLLELTHNLPEGGITGIGLSEIPGRVVIGPQSLGFNRCPIYNLEYRYGDDGRIQKTGGAALPPAAENCPELAGARQAEQLPLPWEAMRVLHGNPLAEKTGEGDLLLSVDGYGLLLSKKPCESLEQSDDHRISRVVDCASPR